MRQEFACAFLLIGVALASCPASTTDWLSPINLQGPRFAPEFKKLHIFSTGEEGLPIENTGETVKVTFPIHFSSDKKDPNANLTDIRVSKGPLLDKYTASHMEFRWGSADGNSGGSDHGFGGVYYPLELQLYLYNTKHQNWDDAVAWSPTSGPLLGDFNADIVALSVMFQVGEQNDELSRITDRLELIRTSPASNTILSSFCFEKVLGQHKRDFYTYTGSTLTAPCVQGVRWIVLTEPLTVSQTQLNQFQALTNAGSPITFPARVSQALNGRLVEVSVATLPTSNNHFQPEFYPHGPPVTVANPLVGGVVIDQGALNADDAANRNYFSPLDKTLEDDSDDSAAASATAGNSDAKLAADASSGVSDESSAAPPAEDDAASADVPADATSPAAADDSSATPTPADADAATPADPSAAAADENAIGDNGAVIEGGANANANAATAAPVDPPNPDATPSSGDSSGGPTPTPTPGPDAGTVVSSPPSSSPPSDGAPPVGGDGSTPPPPPSTPTTPSDGGDAAVPVSAPTSGSDGSTDGTPASSPPDGATPQAPEEGASQQPDGSTTTGESQPQQQPPSATAADDAAGTAAAEPATTASVAVSSARAAAAASSTGRAHGKGKPHHRHQDPIPHFFYLSSTAMYTPEFEPRQHNHEDDHDPNRGHHRWSKQQAAAAAADPNEAVGAEEAAEDDPNTGSLLEVAENSLLSDNELPVRHVLRTQGQQRGSHPIRKLIESQRRRSGN